jgi:hypothetical protein
MKKILITLFLVMLVYGAAYSSGDAESDSEVADRVIVQEQQAHYQKIHPLPFFDYSIPRDVYTQIYEFVTTRAYVTYTVIESMTGATFYHGTSIGYGIPADTSLSNPLQAQWRLYNGAAGIAIEQAEPNGLFSSKNTDGTWVLFIQSDGSVTPIYTEHKVTTFPFKVRQTDSGVWVRADNDPVDFTIKVNK